jgi:hypothetical protein
MENKIKQINDIRLVQKRRYELLKKIKDSIEFDKKERCSYRITRFIKKHIKNIKPINNIPDDVPNEYKFRFYGYINDMLELFLEEYEQTIQNIIDIDIDIIESIKNEMMADAGEKLHTRIVLSPDTIKLRFIIDIRNTKYHNKGNIIDMSDISNIQSKVFIDIITIRKIHQMKKYIIK